MMRIVEGLSWHDENDAVISYIPNMDIKEFEDLTGNDLLCGKITQIKYNTKNNIYTYIVKEVHKDMEVVSKTILKLQLIHLKIIKTVVLCVENFGNNQTH